MANVYEHGDIFLEFLSGPTKVLFSNAGINIPNQLVTFYINAGLALYNTVFEQPPPGWTQYRL
jgi:hypothetical protein